MNNTAASVAKLAKNILLHASSTNKNIM